MQVSLAIWDEDAYSGRVNSWQRLEVSSKVYARAVVGASYREKVANHKYHIIYCTDAKAILRVLRKRATTAALWRKHMAEEVGVRRRRLLHTLA
jgi:hypothetical protein